MKNSKHPLETNTGQSLAELALTMPLLLLILFGVVDLGRLYYAYSTLTNASREGARLGASNPTNLNNAIKIRVKQEAADVLSLGNSNIVIECAAYADTPPYTYSTDCSTATAGGRIRVTVNYDFQFVTLYLFGIQTLGLSNYTSMAILKTN